MNKIKTISIFLSLLTTLSMVGCVCGPRGFYGNCYTSSFGCGSGYDTGCGDIGCDPCGTMSGGVIECSPNPCMSYMAPRMVNCRNSLSNIGNGICVFGRGVLDVAAAPFIIVGNVLSSGCQYNVSVDCGEVYCESACEVVSPCSSCGSTGTSGCANCAGGYSEGIEYNMAPVVDETSAKHSPILSAPRRNSVMQAVYQQPNSKAVKFVQPK